jgi:hypothetical protein
MNSNTLAAHGNRICSATLASAAVVTAALTVMSVSAPIPASAHRADSFAGSVTRCIGGVGSTCTIDIALEVAHRKAMAAQYYVDHAAELHQRAAR